MEPFARGASATVVIRTMVSEFGATLVVDSGGVIAGRIARPADEDHPRFDPPELDLLNRDLTTLVHAVATVLETAEAYGRVAWDAIASRPETLRLYGGARNPPSYLHVSTDSVAPFDEADLQELLSAWTREIAREAGNPSWEPRSRP